MISDTRRRSPSSHLIPALEIGGTHVSGAVVDLGVGRVVAGSVGRHPLDSAASLSAILANLIAAAAPTVAVAGTPRVLGVAIPGPFDHDRGIGRYGGFEKFGLLDGFDLRAALAAELGGAITRIVFMNDADAFALGEWSFGAAAGHRRVVGITLGTGIGSGFVDGGRIVTDGPHVPPDGSVHLLTIAGRPLEETISRRALLDRAKKAIDELPTGADVRDVAALARAGDARARRVFNEAFEALGSTLGPWLAGFDTTVLVVGGSITRSWDLVEPPLVKGLHSGHSSLADLLIRRAVHPEQSALIGAAVHAFRSEEVVPEKVVD